MSKINKNFTPRKAKKNGSLADQSYQMILARLLDHRYSPGTLLNRREIAQELNMSVAPVLEAMVRLESEGYLETLPRKGTLVRAVSITDLRGQVIVREALECEAARYYCGDPIRARKDELHKLALVIDELENPRYGEEWDAEYAFHMGLIQCMDCPQMEAAFRTVMQQKLFSALNLYISTHIPSSRDNHVRLLENLMEAEPDEAENLMRQHLRRSMPRLFERSWSGADQPISVGH
ncbi:MAG: GntR family transcriptional regulator [Verrucomicrobiota bacterium JB024]|jgi:DNA-binding GntR family transcriptional regulator|nr:GntR family transcriptional regulator [Verrucomicrobiota bacterium JB024]